MPKRTMSIEQWLTLACLVGSAHLAGCDDTGGDPVDVGDPATADGAVDADPDTPDASPDSPDAEPDTDGGVTGTCALDPATAENTAAVVEAADALIAAVTDEQQDALLLDFTLADMSVWSNLPVGGVPRNGVGLGEMAPEALDATLELVAAAAGDVGYTLFEEVRAGDTFLVTDGGAGAGAYGEGLYFVAILGTPSTETPWGLQIGGHHLGFNFVYNGACTSATPLFDGTEPTTWTDDDGAEHAPLEAQRAAMAALATAIAGRDGAELDGTFNDLLNGPTGGPGGPGGGGGGGDTRYPDDLTYPTGDTGRGLAVASLSADEQALVLTAMAAWVDNSAEPIADSLLADYGSAAALAETYVAYSGAPDLTAQSSYVRIDGPRVWIEFSVQSGVIYRDRVHYHTLWRDKVADYGAEFASP